MRAFLAIALQVLIIGLNVRVVDAAPAQSMPGTYTLNFPCGTSAAVASMLKDNYREKLLYKGLARSGIMQFYGNPKTNTFSIALETGGLSCLVLVGQYLVKEPEGTPL